MIISFDYGHMEGGEDGSANGFVYEYAEVRKYGQICVNELIRQGHGLINCTPPNGVMTLNESLVYRVSKANASGSQLHLCFHVNASNGQGHGAEMEVYSDISASYGQSILNEIVKLGFSNRGINRPNLYVTKNTNMPCVLTEPFFCDNKQDVNLYNANTLGIAIAKGVIDIVGGNKGSQTDVFVIPIDNDIPPKDLTITPFNGGGWAEHVSDGRTIIHQSRSVYLSLTKDGHLDFTSFGVTKRIV